MNVHFIAIGGAIMHNLAICLQNIGHHVTGSDDIIFDPAKSNLEKAGLLPDEIGFSESHIFEKMDAIILGMHAKEDNVELKRAQELGIRIYSFPEFVFEEAKNKKRVVVAGSHGKTTTTAMIMHVLKELNHSFDYLVGSSLKGFDLSVQLSDAPVIILEGDEYLSSPLEMTSKFHYYQPDIAIVTGIAWDHVNVFPTWDSYVKTFKDFLDNLRESSVAILFSKDETLVEIASDLNCKTNWYQSPKYTIESEKTIVEFNQLSYPLEIFGKHNLENMESARMACLELDISGKAFYEAMQSFKGTAKRLEKIENSKGVVAYRDFAHSPSKLEATLKSVREQYESKTLIACMELHTFSSTDKKFLEEYKGSMLPADFSIIYMSAKAFEIKGRTAISEEEIHKAFKQWNIQICRTPEELKHTLDKIYDKNHVFLLMSSGNFDGLDLSTYFNNAQ
ncbi:MAG: UDP-N-acetylmuramate: L-alanyl-gamma-D-glutamyl-meso-diaminopimelate ligase [Chitinophagales bacterium]|jgi:UDP-N-acetylmuramate: L-alanyl-gamma-D-glutamyl-meso-diaminopimelate ligase